MVCLDGVIRRFDMKTVDLLLRALGTGRISLNLRHFVRWDHTEFIILSVGPDVFFVCCIVVIVAWTRSCDAS